jgi:hypothetical protein
MFVSFSLETCPLSTQADASNRMLKKSASGVLASLRSSTYPRGYASGSSLAAALLNGPFEHPVGGRSPRSPDVKVIENLQSHNIFPAAC